MVGDEVDGFEDGGVGVVEAVKPVFKVDSAVFHEGDVLFVDATLTHEVEHFFSVHTLNSAAGVADDHHFVDAKFVDGDEEGADGGVEGVGDGAAGVLDDFDIAVFDAKCGGEELYQASVHAGDDGEFFVGVFAGGELFVFFVFDEASVVLEHFFDHDSWVFVVIWIRW